MLSKMKTTFIYALNCPFSGRTRYVGKSDNPEHRLLCHVNASEVCHRTNWIRSLQAKGKLPVLEILDEVPQDSWTFWEKEYIMLYRALGFDLVNGTEGGDGLFNPSKETRRKMGEWQRGEKNNMFGRKFTSAQLNKWRIQSLNRKNLRNTSGFVGVTWHKRTNRWRAFITVESRPLTLGAFQKLEDAVFVRSLAFHKYFNA